MYINRALLMIIVFVVIFFPIMGEWVLQSGAPWYRPYQVWLTIIIAAYWNQRTRATDEL